MNTLEVFVTVGLSLAIGMIVASAVYVWFERRAEKGREEQLQIRENFRRRVYGQPTMPEVAPEEEPEPQPEKRRPGRPRKGSVPAPSSRSTH